jgi:hypothetical protein
LRETSIIIVRYFSDILEPDIYDFALFFLPSPRFCRLTKFPSVEGKKCEENQKRKAGILRYFCLLQQTFVELFINYNHFDFFLKFDIISAELF